MLTDDKIIKIYCIIDDILKGTGHKEDSGKVSDSKIITTAVISSLFRRLY